MVQRHPLQSSGVDGGGLAVLVGESLRRAGLGFDQPHAHVPALQRPRHLLLELEDGLIGIPTRRPHIGDQSGHLTAVLAFHGIGEGGLLVHGGLRLMDADVGILGGPSAGSMGHARDALARAVAVGGIRGGPRDARQLRVAVRASLRHVINLLPAQVVAACRYGGVGQQSPRRDHVLLRFKDLVETLGAPLVVDEGAGAFRVAGGGQRQGRGLRGGGFEHVEHHHVGGLGQGPIDRLPVHSPMQIVFQDNDAVGLAVSQALKRILQGQFAAEQCRAETVGLPPRQQ